MPSRQGRVPVPSSGAFARLTLDRLPLGASGVVVDVAAARYDLVREGIRAGSRLVVAARAPLGGPTIVDLGGARVALSRDVARSITVQVGSRPGTDRSPEATPAVTSVSARPGPAA